MNPARASSIYLLGNLAAAAVPFLLLPLLTRVLSPAAYGAIVNFMLLNAACVAFAGLGVHGMLGVAWFRQQGDSLRRETSAAVVVAVGSTLLCAAVVGLVVAALAPAALGFGAFIAALAALTAGAQTLLQCRLALWQSAARPWSNAAAQLLAAALNMGLSLLAVLALGWGAEGRIGGMAVAAWIMAALALWWLHGDGLLARRAGRTELRAALAFGVPLVPHVLAGVLLSGGDRIVVSARLGTDGLGPYGAAAQLGAVMAILADAFVKAFNPWLFRRLQDGGAPASLQALGGIYAAVPGFVLLGAAVGLALTTLGGWMLGPDYRPALGVLPWFVIGGTFSGLYLAVSGLYFFHGRTGLLSSFSLPCALLGLAATVALVGTHGVHGAAAGYALTQGLLAATAWAVAMRCFDLPWARPVAALACWRAGLKPVPGGLQP